MVARLKFKGIDGRAKQGVEPAASLGPAHAGPDMVGIGRLMVLS